MIADQARFDRGKLLQGHTLFAIFAAHCPVCRHIKPDLMKMLAKFPHVSYYEADAVKSPALVAHYHVQTLPLILIHKNGAQVHASEGAVDVAGLEAKLR